MDLRKLEHFEAVSRLKSFTKAAKELHVSQPSITTSIKKLENELGIQLFLRAQNEIILTEAGKLLRERAVAILGQLNSSFLEMLDFGDKCSRQLRFAAPTALGSWIFPLIFTQYTKQYPDVQINALERGVNAILELLLKDQLDLGFVVLDNIDTDIFRVKYFSTGRLYALLPAQHPLAKLEEVPLASFAAEQLILPSGAGYLHTRFNQECARLGLTPQIAFAPLQVVTTLNTVASGGGVSIVLDDRIAAIKDNPNMVVKPFLESLSFETGFVWLQKKYLPNVAKEFMKFLDEHKP